MSVVQLRADTQRSPSDFTPAIRTPDQFREASLRVDSLLSNLAAGDLGDSLDVIQEIQNLKRAIDASPFMQVDTRIVRRGAAALRVIQPA